MKKVFLAMMFLVAGLLSACGASINGEEVGSIKNPLDDSTYCEQCNLRFTFTSGIDAETGHEYWKYLEIDNYEDRGARVWIVLENGGYILEDEFIWNNSDDFKRQIHVRMNEKIIIHIERSDPETDTWEQCGDDKSYKLD